MVLLCTAVALVAFAGCDSQEQTALSPEELALQFEDVTQYDWFYRYVVAGLRFGLIEGASEDNPNFEPERYVTQGEFIAMLGRLHEYGHGVIGVPVEGGDYERHVVWALEIGIVHRYEYWDLAPDELITREQAAVIVWKYIHEFQLRGYFAYNGLVHDETFSDFSEASFWARWLIEDLRYFPLVFGRAGPFEPHVTVTTADTVQLLVRVCVAVYDHVHPLRPKPRS